MGHRGVSAPVHFWHADRPGDRCHLLPRVFAAVVAWLLLAARLLRFSLGVFTTLAVLVGSLAFTSDSPAGFWHQVQQMFGWTTLRRKAWKVSGVSTSPPVYRYPVLVALLVFCCSLAFWPAQKNLGTLMSCSAAVMVATQFWHPRGGGLYMGWYLPLVLLTIFRPNLEDRVALSVLGEGWFPKRRWPIWAAPNRRPDCALHTRGIASFR